MPLHTLMTINCQSIFSKRHCALSCAKLLRLAAFSRRLRRPWARRASHEPGPAINAYRLDNHHGVRSQSEASDPNWIFGIAPWKRWLN
jgi:hypothetical protein